MSEGQVLMGESGVGLGRAVVTAGARTAVLVRHGRGLRGKRASEANGRSGAWPVGLHVGMHGFFGEDRSERDNPLFGSGPKLDEVEHVEVDRERDDGQLTAYEVSGMDLRGTRLMVLSACETGLGAPVEAEGKKSRGTKRRWCFLWRKSHRRLRATVVARPSPRIVCLAALQRRGR